MAAVLQVCYTTNAKMPDVAPKRGIVSQPSVSMKLLRAQTIEAGSEIWAEDESDGGEEVWMLAQVLRQDNTLLTVRKKKTGEELEIDLVSVCGVTNPGCWCVRGLGADAALGDCFVLVLLHFWCARDFRSAF